MAYWPRSVSLTASTDCRSRRLVSDHSTRPSDSCRGSSHADATVAHVSQRSNQKVREHNGIGLGDKFSERSGHDPGPAVQAQYWAPLAGGTETRRRVPTTLYKVRKVRP